MIELITLTIDEFVPSCCYFHTSGTEAASREGEEQVLESLVSLTTSKRVLASLLPEMWQRAEALLAEGLQERCLLYLSTVNKVMFGNLWMTF